MQESTDHAALIQLFRDDPSLAATLLTRVFGLTVPPLPARVLDPVLKPGTLIPDLVIALAEPLDPERPALIIIVEAQRSIDPDKRFTWPVYLWLERLRWRCEVVLLVVAPDAAVAEWAEQPIVCGPDNRTRALVLGPRRIPWISDPAEARAAPALTLLSARAHGREVGGLVVVRAALAVLQGFDSGTLRMYIELALGKLTGRTLRRFQEELMREQSQFNYPTPVLDKLLEELAQWREARAEARGKALGAAEGRRQALLRVIGARGVSLAPEQLERILECRTIDQLDAWLGRAGTATTAAELLGE